MHGGTDQQIFVAGVRWGNKGLSSVVAVGEGCAGMLGKACRSFCWSHCSEKGLENRRGQRKTWPLALILVDWVQAYNRHS